VLRVGLTAGQTRSSRIDRNKNHRRLDSAEMNLTGVDFNRKGCEALFNGKLIFLQTLSGYRGPRDIDPRGPQRVFEADVDDAVLGQAVTEVVAKSRFVLPKKRTDVIQHPLVEFDAEMYDKAILRNWYQTWSVPAMERFGFRDEKDLFRRMKRCAVEVNGLVMTITPTHHESLFGWGREEGDGIEDVELDVTSSAADIGAALRLAFSRCTGR